MVKVYGPMMSFDASGTLAKTATFSKWKGRNYVRQRVVPANPKSGGQVGVRAMFKFLSQYWTYTTTAHRATWDDLAAQKVISTFNAYMGANQARWRNFLGPAVRHPADETGTQPDAPTTTPTDGARQISLSIAQGANEADLCFMIHRSQSTGFTPAFTNCIAVVNILGEDPVLYVDTPLAIGTYYYRIRGCLDTGLLGILEAEITDTVA